ncbi:MAG: DUF87 domain-containing protein [Candidatus Diapherotrites archaeon]
MLLSFFKRGNGKSVSLKHDLQPLLRPHYIKNEFDCVRVNSQYNRVVMAVGYPRLIREGWLGSIVSSEGDFDLSMFITPANIDTIMTGLNQELVKQESDIMSAEMKGIVNPSLRVQHQDTLGTLEKLQKGEEKLFNIALYVNARAPSREKLELLSRKIESELNSIMIIPKTPCLRMLQALQSVIPLQRDRLNVTRNITSHALGACFPFTSAFLNMDEEGIMVGLNKENNIPIIINPYGLTNYNGLILGTSGGGKSFYCKLFILRNLLKGVKVNIIDPQGEYTDVVKTYNGQVVKISRESETIINPFDLMGQDFGEKMLILMDLFRIMCGELSEVQKNILDKCVQSVYEQKGIISNNKSTWGKKPPVMEDLYNEIEKEKQGGSKIERMTYDALANRIRIYAKGSFSFLNRQTNLDLENDFISFDIAEMPSQVKPVMMFLILEFVRNKMHASRERKLLVIDEAWTLLRYGQHSRYIFEMIKTARKFGLGLVIITQEVNDLLSSKAGATTLANTAWKLLLRQEPAVMKELSEKFNLNEEEQGFLLTATQGEGLLFAMNDHIPLRVVASEKEHELITTNPDEVRMREKVLKGMAEKKEEDFSPYHLEKRYYALKDLNEDQVKFLKAQGFVESRQPGLGEGRGQAYLIKKPAGKESLKHAFLVELIADELRKYTDTVSVKFTKEADITFIAPNRTGHIKGLNVLVAVEVETGSVAEKKAQIEEKVRALNERYKLWFFVVTDKELKKEYAQYGEVLTRTEVGGKVRKLFENSQKQGF